MLISLPVKWTWRRPIRSHHHHAGDHPPLHHQRQTWHERLCSIIKQPSSSSLHSLYL